MLTAAGACFPTTSSYICLRLLVNSKARDANQAGTLINVSSISGDLTCRSVEGTSSNGFWVIIASAAQAQAQSGRMRGHQKLLNIATTRTPFLRVEEVCFGQRSQRP